MNFHGKQVLVLGLAMSGAAVARLLKKHGADVVVNDQKPLDQLGDSVVAELQSLGIEVIGGGHPEGIVHDGLAFLVKNPGIPYKAAPVRQALELGVPVVTEVEVAYHLAHSPIIGITGSNGKTTTTTLVGKMLEEAGRRPVVCGNIGHAMSTAITEADEEQWLVAELSSFQLMGTVEFQPKIAALLNIYPAHLDYHGTMEEYVAAKLRLFANQTEDDVAVVNWDQEILREAATEIVAQVVPFSLTQVLETGVFVKDGNIHARMHGKDMSILPTSDVLLKGEYNLENLLAAAAIALSAGATPQAVADVARTFRGVEHRNEYVTTRLGVEYYNNSKATNSEAAMRGIEAFDGNVVLIAGGLDRGVDFKELVPTLRDKVKHMVVIGEAAPKLHVVAAEAGVSCEQAATLEAAVQQAARHAVAGDVVLLSPACASWDMFKSFEERGDMFKKAVHTL